VKSGLFAATCLVAVAQIAAPAHAQQTATNAGAGTTLGEVVVTAEKREQSLQQVPVAVSAYTSVRRDVIGINTIQDLTNYTPGFSYSTSLDRAFIRGIGRETNNLSTDAGVATYVDGLYNSATVAAANDSLFIQRIEILRGPQGTLYGRNSIGGTVNAISFRPTNTYYAEARGGYGNYGAYKGEVAVSGPITDHLRFRLAAEDVGQTRGYFTNVANNTTEGGNDETKYIEVQFAGDAGPFEAWIKADATDFHGHDLLANDIGSYDYNKYNTVVALTPNGPYGYTLPGFTEIGTATQNPAINNIRLVNAAINNRAFDKSYNFTTQLTWHLSGADIKYIGGWAGLTA
jgi:iron complex outermembrane receptor protein